MNNKVLINLAVFIGIIALGLYIYSLAKAEPQKVENIKKQEVNEKEEIVEDVPKETILKKDGFLMVLPVGWEEVVDFQNVLAMAIDSKEEITDEQIKAIGFRTNFSVKSDDLEKYDMLSNIGEYVESIKDSLVSMIPSIKFLSKNEAEINNNNAIYIECESIQEETAFKTLLVFVEGNDNIVWAISFNTLENSWLEYKDVFYQISQSFELE